MHTSKFCQIFQSKKRPMVFISNHYQLPEKMPSWLTRGGRTSFPLSLVCPAVIVLLSLLIVSVERRARQSRKPTKQTGRSGKTQESGGKGTTGAQNILQWCWKIHQYGCSVSTAVIWFSSQGMFLTFSLLR